MAIEITLLEIDAPNAVFNAPLSGRGRPTRSDQLEENEAESRRERSAAGHETGNRAIPVLALFGLLAIAVIVRALREEPLEDE
ncbi:MAG: hypothetical protein R3324_01645 [Halobacteriales archaeon]|nr:hypothetical protein [Halobacteriales archaeon]